MSNIKSFGFTLKNIFAAIIAMLVIVSITSAQDKHKAAKKETAKESSSCCSTESKAAADHCNSAEQSKSGMTSHKKEVTSVKNASAKTDAPWNVVCPVLGDKVNPEVKTVTYKGKVYGFCCPGCDEKFTADPEKYIKNLSSDGKSFVGKM